MIRILAEADDPEGPRLQAALQERAAQVELVTLTELTQTCGLTLRVDTRESFSRVSMRDGRVLSSADSVLVINRLRHVAAHSGDPVDADYIAEEWRAVLAAWLRTLRGLVLNPPRAATLSGPELSTLHWRSLAHAHGLRTLPVVATQRPPALETMRVVCLMSRCYAESPVSPRTAARLSALAQHCGTPLLAASFERHEDEYRLADIDPRPELSSAPDEVLRALIDYARSQAVTS